MATPKEEPVRRPERASSSAVDPRLLESLVGLDLIDGDLSIDGERVADWVGVDPHGRVVLVLHVGDDDAAAALATLDALAFARANGELLAEHLGSSRVRPGRPPRVVLVGDRIAERLLERLDPLLGKYVDAYHIRHVESASGARSYLVPSVTRAAGDEPGPAITADAFASSLPSSQQEMARTLLARMSRLDDELEAMATSEGVTWRFRDDPLARLESVGGALQGSVPPRNEPRPLRDGTDVEFFLEEALSRYVDRLGDEGTGGLGYDGDDVALGAAADETPNGPLAILTPEEIEAFRQ